METHMFPWDGSHFFPDRASFISCLINGCLSKAEVSRLLPGTYIVFFMKKVNFVLLFSIITQDIREVQPYNKYSFKYSAVPCLLPERDENV